MAGPNAPTPQSVLERLTNLENKASEFEKAAVEQIDSLKARVSIIENVVGVNMPEPDPGTPGMLPSQF